MVKRSSPFRLMMGYEPLAIPRIRKGSDLPAVEERIDQLRKAREEALALHELARQHVASRVTRTFTPFKEGNKVWLEARNLQTHYESRKLSPRREGPFVITEVFEPLVYKLKLPQRWKIHPIFHASLLTPYK